MKSRERGLIISFFMILAAFIIYLYVVIFMYPLMYTLNVKKDEIAALEDEIKNLNREDYRYKGLTAQLKGMAHLFIRESDKYEFLDVIKNNTAKNKLTLVNLYMKNLTENEQEYISIHFQVRGSYVKIKQLVKDMDEEKLLFLLDRFRLTGENLDNASFVYKLYIVK